MNDLIADIRQKVPNIGLRTTLIVGYPGETEEDFQILKDWVKAMRFDRLGCFAYSHEENTHAYLQIDDVPEDIKKARIEEIMAIQEKISDELNRAKAGKIFRVLIDRKQGKKYIGRTEFDSPEVDNEVHIIHDDLKIGEFYPVKITETSPFDLFGEVI